MRRQPRVQVRPWRPWRAAPHGRQGAAPNPARPAGAHLWAAVAAAARQADIDAQHAALAGAGDASLLDGVAHHLIQARQGGMRGAGK